MSSGLPAGEAIRVITLIASELMFSRIALCARRAWRRALLSVFLALFAGGAWGQSLEGAGRQLPEGPGKEETQKLCVKCHDIERAVSRHQDREAWRLTMEKMVALGTKGTDEELGAVFEYLVKNFPAEEVPRISVNQARAIDLESGLTLTRSQAAAIIQYRTKNGPFKSIEDLKKVPGVDAAKIEAKKDRLAF